VTNEEVRLVRPGSSRCQDSHGTTWTIDRVDRATRGWLLRVRCQMPGPMEKNRGQDDLTSLWAHEEGLVLL
jgi:hypothetical protein